MHRPFPFLRGRRLSGLVMVGAALTAAAVRLPGAFELPFWEDEVASARILRQPTFGSMLHRVGLTESTPPFWYALGWVVHLAGVSLRDERLLSVACGALLAAAVVALALRFVELPFAAAAGLMTAVGGQFVWHGHELRAYELFSLVCCLFGLCLVRTLETHGRGWDIGLATTVAVGGSTHYFFVFSVLAALAWLWLDPRARAARNRATLSIVAGGVLAAAWLPLMLEQYRHDRFSWIGPFHLRHVVAVPLRLFTTAWNGTMTGAVLSLATLVVVVFGCRRLTRSSPGAAVAALALAPLAEAAAVWRSGSEIFADRNLIGIGPFVAIAVVAALEALPRRLAVLAAATTVASLGLSLAVSGAQRLPPFDAIARTLVRDGWNRRLPIVVYGDPRIYRWPLEWYLPRQPTLDLVRPGHLSCAPLFVVHASGRVTVIRRTETGTVQPRLPRATLLVEPDGAARCDSRASAT